MRQIGKYLLMGIICTAPVLADTQINLNAAQASVVSGQIQVSGVQVPGVPQTFAGTLAWDPVQAVFVPSNVKVESTPGTVCTFGIQTTDPTTGNPDIEFEAMVTRGSNNLQLSVTGYADSKFDYTGMWIVDNQDIVAYFANSAQNVTGENYVIGLLTPATGWNGTLTSMTFGTVYTATLQIGPGVSINNTSGATQIAPFNYNGPLTINYVDQQGNTTQVQC